MSIQAPPNAAIAAILAPTTDITVRVEIYEVESDGQLSLWMASDDIGVIDGSVNVSNSRDERRTLDLTLDNQSGALNNHPGGFWYDKIIKVYRGVTWEVFDFSTQPGRTNPTWGDLNAQGFTWNNMLQQQWGAITVNPNADPVALTPQTFSWECQIGEFMIDSISIDNFPHVVKITGRDYTKKLLASKLPNVTTFIAGTTLESIVKIMALNGGIYKFNLPNTGKVLTQDARFDRGATRWSVLQDLSAAYSLDIFVDAQGALTLKQFEDPTTSPEIFSFQTGPKVGNMVKFTKKSSDAQIFNHIVASGEGTNTSLVGGEAVNYEPTSPTAVQYLGDRTYLYTSSLITSQQQAKDVAANMLAYYALEQFEVDMETICFPWLEAGYVIRFLDPDPIPGQPERYLLTDFSISLKPGSMSLTTKRITIVGSPTTIATAPSGSAH